VPLDEKRLFRRNQNRSTVACQNGIVCASEPLAAMAGIDVLKAGGNCIDAAIATNAVLGVTEPAMNGIGGDLFAILWHEKDARLYGLNASGRAAREFDLVKARELKLESIPRRSTLSWSVPGCVDGWSMLSERFGKKSLASCLDAAIGYATDGFPLSPIISSHFGFDRAENPSLSEVYHQDGVVPGFGDVFRNPLLAKSLRQIAEQGRDAFYQGEIAHQIVAKAKAEQGLLSLSDLELHRGSWVDPVSSSYRGYDVWEIPPNGQGIAALQILNLLELFDIASMDPNSAEYLHLLIEAKKLAFEDRALYYADPEFADIPVAELISKSYAAQRVKLIDRTRASRRPVPGDPSLDSDTIYLSAADRDGNMISLIQSVYSAFGSTLCPDGVGFPMQNRGQAFSLDPRHNNRLEPGKRPFHTIIPAFVTLRGRPLLSFGVMGGDFQPQGHAQVLVNMLDFGMSPQQAGEQPRLAHDGSSTPWGGEAEGGGRLLFEHGFDPAVREKLASMGHQLSDSVSAHGGYQAVWRQESPRIYFGGTDPRKDGAALGY
jgi:gamma-glutamyltranspeptidase/glutathione hydrolase